MNIQGKKVLILGGAGMVGMAVAREMLKENPASIVVHSLREGEATDAVEALEKEQDLVLERASLFSESPAVGRVRIVPEWGNLFVRLGLHLREPGTLMGDAEARRSIIRDLIGELGDADAARFFLYDLVSRHRPHLVVDTVNTATGIAYGDLYTVSADAYAAVTRADAARPAPATGGDEARDGAAEAQRKPAGYVEALEALQEATERLIATQYVPQLVRHVQVLWKAMKESGTSFYVKVGTSGTGGMGLNIPYTHGEERPSRMLLSKSAVAGAHTLLLFLQARTPESPITKEIKPAAAIAWKKFGYGEVKRRGKPVRLEAPQVVERLLSPLPSAVGRGGADQVDPAMAQTAAEATSRIVAEQGGGAETLKSVYVDTGENGVFSVDEFKAISTAGQMEFVTPEEIARNLIAEVKGANTGKDVIDALNIAIMGPTYRAGFLRNNLLDKLRRLQEDMELKENGTLAMAFEVLGPPRLSKLLYESYLLKLSYQTVEAAAKANPSEMASRLRGRIEGDAELTKKIVSIGIPVLIEDGENLRLLRGREVAIPKKGQIDLSDEAHVATWSEAGWVDLRLSNMERWTTRMRALLREIELIPATDTSSRYVRDREFWGGATGPAPIDPGEVVGWLFNTEDQGERGR